MKLRKIDFKKINNKQVTAISVALSLVLLVFVYFIVNSLSSSNADQEATIQSSESTSSLASSDVQSSAVSSDVSSAVVSSEVKSEPPSQEVSKKENNTQQAAPAPKPAPPVQNTPPPASVPVNNASTSYLNDVVFIGDSISLKLNYYSRSNPQIFGTAQFLTSGSMGSGNALQPVSDSSIHPSYQGVKMSLEDAVSKMGVNKVYIMLGMNDVGLYGIDGAISNMTTLLSRIKAKSPNVKIVVESVTPMLRDRSSSLTNTNLSIYNDRLAQMCSQNGYYFVDVASVMRTSSGTLIPAYCSDPEGMGMHFTDAGCKVWIDYILSHAV